MPSAFDPTPRYIVEAVRDALVPTSTDVFYDLGSGDGRWVAAMAQAGVLSSVGIENDPEILALGNRFLATLPFTNMSIIEGDIYLQDVSDGTIFWPNINYRSPTLRLDELKALIPSGARVVVNDTTWGWPKEPDIVIPEGQRQTAVTLSVYHVDDTTILKYFTVQEIIRNYPSRTHEHWAKVGEKRLTVYRVP